MENNMSISLGLIIIVVFLGIIFATGYSIFIKRDNEGSNNNVHIKNIFVNIGLIILSGVIFILYEKIFDKIYIEKWPSLFVGIVTMFQIFLLNFIGIIFSIMYSKKAYITLINYGGFIVSTILTIKLISFCVNLLENTKIISECSGIFSIILLIVLENIFSYLIVRLIIRIKN
jgi:hypothetical protein